MESVSRYNEVIERSDKVREEVLQYLKEREENREIYEKMHNLAFTYRLMKEEESQIEGGEIKGWYRELEKNSRWTWIQGCKSSFILGSRRYRNFN